MDVTFIEKEHSDLIGGSSAGRVIACPGSVEMLRRTPKRPSSAYADEGTMLHEAITLVINGTADISQLVEQKFTHLGHTLTQELADEMLVPALEHLDTIADILDDGELEIFCELKVHYDGIEAFGTCDVIATTTGGKYVLVLDWKFGRGVKVDIVDNKQTRFYAGAARERRPEMFKGREIMLAIVQPAIDDGFGYEIITNEELDEFVVEMRAGVQRVLDGDTTLNPGKHCKWCSPICPARISGAQELLKRTKELDPQVPPNDLGELVAMAYEAEEAAKAILQMAHEELEKGRGVTGYKLVAKRATRKWIDEAAAEKELRGLKLKVDDITERSLISPAQAEKLFKRKGWAFSAMDNHVEAKSSGTTMAPESDGRPAVKSRFEANPLDLPTKKED